MPPFVPRKRPRSRSPALHTPSDKHQSSGKPSRTRAAQKNGKRPTLFNAVDHDSNATPSAADNEAFLQKTDSPEPSGSEDSSDVSELDSDEFEDVIPTSTPKRRKVESNLKPTNTKDKSDKRSADQDNEEDEDEMEWEDATNHPAEPIVSGDLHLTLDEIPEQTVTSFTDPHGQKKGPTKIERQIRTNAHCMHVQSLMYHNFLRNRWLRDEKLQKILVDKLPEWMEREVKRYKTAAGLPDNDTNKNVQPSSKSTARKKDKSKKKQKKDKPVRDWGNTAAHADHDPPFLVSGDPTLPFLRYLVSFWRKKFRITAPGLRKQGYKDLPRLEQELKSFRNDQHNPLEHGERIRNLDEFYQLAETCTGSRDVGAQLFTALLRGIGFEARMTTNLQPVGYGWNKVEEAPPPKEKNRPAMNGSKDDTNTLQQDGKANSQVNGTKSKTTSKPQRSHNGGTKAQPIQLSDDDSGLSSAPESNEDDDAVQEAAESVASSKRYDRDLPYPIYWTEVLSPVSHTWIPLDPIVLSIIVAKPEDCSKFEPRGSRAERSKQIFAYVVAFAGDGSAKDVTVRYMKNHMWPGKTKGVRMPVEKVAVYNRRGKVERYEEYDWFKTVMSCYRKFTLHRSPADDIEDSRELLAVKPNRQSSNAGAETLQGYKQSAEFVLERHLRREEALIPEAKIVKWFKTGKGEDEKQEPVYHRADVVPCKSNESWHKEGRAIKEGEQALKYVPMRAVTTTRKREIEEAERESGEKLKQGLYARYQTDWIIPPPIEDGVIPKNAYGNMDVFVPTMVPKGAVHIPLRATAKICRRLGIDHAEACTGFEFGNRMAVPVLTGVVVAKENEDTVIDAWETEEAERKKKEEAKREKTALGMWKKMLAGLKVLERVRNDYGEGAELKFDALNLDNKAKKGKNKDVPQPSNKIKSQHVSSLHSKEDGPNSPQPTDMDGDLNEGGFIREGMNVSPSPRGLAANSKRSGDSIKSGRESSLSELSEIASNHESQSSDVESGKTFSKPDERAKKKPKKLPNRTATHTPSTATPGRRNASRKSKEAVRSRYFEENSDAEESS